MDTVPPELPPHEGHPVLQYRTFYGDDSLATDEALQSASAAVLAYLQAVDGES